MLIIKFSGEKKKASSAVSKTNFKKRNSKIDKVSLKKVGFENDLKELKVCKLAGSQELSSASRSEPATSLKCDLEDFKIIFLIGLATKRFENRVFWRHSWKTDKPS